MDNAFIADSVIVLILILGAVVGAKRGLIKSMMGVFVVIGALIGAQMLADMLTDPITDAVATRIEDKVLRGVSELRDSGSRASQDKLLKQFEQYGIPSELLDQLLDAAAEVLNEAVAPAKQQTAAYMKDTLSSTVRMAIRGTVHTVLVLVCYLVLFVALTLLAGVLDRVFDLPLLDMTNAVGGAMMGVLEAGAVLFVLLFFASRFGVTAITEHADEGRLLPFFMLRKSLGIFPSL